MIYRIYLQEKEDSASFSKQVNIKGDHPEDALSNHIKRHNLASGRIGRCYFLVDEFDRGTLLKVSEPASVLFCIERVNP